MSAVLFLLVVIYTIISVQSLSPYERRPYQVYRILPNDTRQLKAVVDLLDRASDYELNFWKAPRGIGSLVDVMVPPEMYDKFPVLLNVTGLHYRVTIADVQKLIETREHWPERSEENKVAILGSFMRRLHDSRPFYNFRVYGSYAQMQRYMRALARARPRIAKLVSIGLTHEGRSIDGLQIGKPGKNGKKRVIWIDGGIHAREWAAPHTALYFIKQLLTKYGTDRELTAYVDELTWLIIPCLNPDGYQYTRSSRNPNTRLWRKNRSPERCIVSRWARRKCCKGVDLNRNFDFHWGETGSSRDVCSEVYAGTGPFSEPESRAVRDYVTSKHLAGRIDAFITMHTYSQLWIHPFGHRRDNYPGDVNELYRLGKTAATALASLYGTRYVVGSGADTLYPAAGGSDDWAKQTAGVKYVYLLELRPDERQWDGFILDERELIPTAKETWMGVKVVADAVLRRQKLASTARDSGTWLRRAAKSRRG